MAAKRKKTIKEEELINLKLVRAVLPFYSSLKPAVHPEHGNVKLQITDTLTVLLCGFFNPAVDSLRMIEQLSKMPWVQEHTNIDRVCRSTLSDAMERFDPKHLLPVINQLMSEMPYLSRNDRDLANLCKSVIAADGSVFNLASDVTWALMRSRRAKDAAVPDNKSTRKTSAKHATCRLNLQLDTDHFTPSDLSVSGADEGSEAAAFMNRVMSGVIYLLDRNFVHFGMINAVLECDSDLVLRLRKDTKFEVSSENTLCDRDRQEGVVSDRVGILPGSPGGRTGPPPARKLREVIVNGEDGKPLRLITSLLDVPAYVIAALYRRRWQIELFFRWLKVLVGFEHLMSHSQKGVTFHFYVAVIGCLLMHVRTGRKVNKYSLFLFGQVAAGHVTLEEILPMLQRIEREKELERQRLARKRESARKAAAQKIETPANG